MSIATKGLVMLSPHMQHLRKFLEYKYDIDSINENKINYLQKRHLDKKKDKNNQETDLQDKT